MLAALSITSPAGPAWEFLVLFGVVIVGPPLVSRARIPGIIGLLLGGFAIGGHGLGWIGQGNTTVPELGQLGLLYLMFVAGVELDLVLLRVHRRAVLTFAALTFSIPMAAGTAVGLVLGWTTPAALLLGSLIASYTLLLYPTARAAGLATNPAVAGAVGAAVITDTLSLVILAVVAGSNVDGGTPLALAGQIGLGLAVLLAFSLVALPRLARLAFRHLGSDRAVRYLLAVAAFLAAATVAGCFGIEGIVGAFFAGLALNRMVPNEGQLMDRINFFGAAVFIPLFLVSVGMLLDPAVMVRSATLGLAGLMIVACVGGKLAAALLTRRIMGWSRAQGSMLFSLSTTQAAATLATTIVGFDIGLFGEAVVNAALVLILVSIVTSTIVIERAKRRVPPAEPPARVGSRVLVALEDPAQAPGAFAIAARVAEPDGGVVHGLLASSPADARRNAARLAELGAVGLAAGIDTEPVLLVERSLADGVIQAAVAAEASLVLVGQRDAPAPSPFGTWEAAVAEAAPAAVVILRGAPAWVGEVRLVRTGGAAGAGDALLAAELALRIGGPRVRAHEPDGPDWIGALTPGQLAIVPAAAAGSFADTLVPPEGAAILLVLDPVVPSHMPAPAPDDQTVSVT